MHQKNIVHGNLKCSNVLLDKEGNSSAKLSDIVFWQVGKQNCAETYLNLASAPEIILKSTEPSKKSDMWSFGYIVLEVLRN